MVQVGSQSLPHHMNPAASLKHKKHGCDESFSYHNLHRNTKILNPSQSVVPEYIFVFREKEINTKKSTLHTNCLENLLYKLGLHHSKQLPSLAKTDFYSTNISTDSTWNAPKNLNTLNTCHI